MGSDARQNALSRLLDRAGAQGYVTFDQIIECADVHALPIQDFDWLSNAVTTRGILVYDGEPTARADPTEETVDDYSQIDYDEIYDRIIALDSSLTFFVNTVRGIKPPQYREVSQLKHLVREGNSHARSRMIEMHLRIALKTALQRAETFDYDVDEAIQLACIGLITAVDKYDPFLNGAFSSYATMYMLQSMAREQPTRNALVYYPVHMREMCFAAYPILKQRGCLTCPSIWFCDKIRALLTTKLEYTPNQCEEVIRASLQACSLEKSLEAFDKDIQAAERNGDDPSKTENYRVFAYASDEEIEDIIYRQQQRLRISQVLRTMKPREREVMILRYGLDGSGAHTLEQVGQHFDVTRERIRQIEAKALRKLQHPSRKRNLFE